MSYHQEQMITFSETYINCQIYFYRIFGGYMYLFTAAQETSTTKFSAFVQRFRTEEPVLKRFKMFTIPAILMGHFITF